MQVLAAAASVFTEPGLDASLLPGGSPMGSARTSDQGEQRTQYDGAFELTAASPARGTTSFVAASLITPGALSGLVPPPSLAPQPQLTKPGSLKRGSSNTAQAPMTATSDTVPPPPTVHSELPTRVSDPSTRADKAPVLPTAPSLTGSFRRQSNSGLPDGEDGDTEEQWLGEDVRRALVAPRTGYWQPHVGLVSPPGTLVSRLKTDKVHAAAELLDPEHTEVGHDPTTPCILDHLLGCSSKDVQ
ncbi:hypothetical protein V8C86DRAFT_562927 [Haematococcus lacustris]